MRISEARRLERYSRRWASPSSTKAPPTRLAYVGPGTVSARQVVDAERGNGSRLSSDVAYHGLGSLAVNPPSAGKMGSAGGPSHSDVHDPDAAAATQQSPNLYATIRNALNSPLSSTTSTSPPLPNPQVGSTWAISRSNLAPSCSRRANKSIDCCRPGSASSTKPFGARFRPKIDTTDPCIARSYRMSAPRITS